MDAEEICHRTLAKRKAGESWDNLEILWTFTSGSTRKLVSATFVVKESKDCTDVIETLSTTGTSPGITIPDANVLRVVIMQHTPTLTNRNWNYYAYLKCLYDDGMDKTFHVFTIPVEKL